MTRLDSISEEIEQLSNPMRDEVLKQEPLETTQFVAHLQRAQEICQLRELYAKRGEIHKNNQRYSEAAMDYYKSAGLRHCASMNLFCAYDAERIENYFKLDHVPADMTSDIAFMHFIQYSTGLGKAKDSAQALTHLVYSSKLGHPETKYISENVYTLVALMREKKIHSTTFTVMNHDKAMSTMANLEFEKQLYVPAYQHYLESMRYGLGGAHVGLGYMYFFGDGHYINAKHAMHHFVLAVEFGNLEDLPKYVYLKMQKMIEAGDESIIAFLNSISTSRLMTLNSFSNNLSRFIGQSNYSWLCYMEESVPINIQNKIYEILALSEITRQPHDCQAGLTYMRRITNLQDCSVDICKRLIQFHQGHHNRQSITKSFNELMTKFQTFAHKEPTEYQPPNIFRIENKS